MPKPGYRVSLMLCVPFPGVHQIPSALGPGDLLRNVRKIGRNARPRLLRPGYMRRGSSAEKYVDKDDRRKHPRINFPYFVRVGGWIYDIFQTVSSISTKRRIVLTGTPIQNDLQEFFSIIEFCNPCILGSSAKFKKVYEVPILKSNEPDAGKEARDLGEARAAELNRLISLFTLRRTSEVISKYLPPKGMAELTSVLTFRRSLIRFSVYFNS